MGAERPFHSESSHLPTNNSITHNTAQATLTLPNQQTWSPPLVPAVPPRPAVLMSSCSTAPRSKTRRRWAARATTCATSRLVDEKNEAVAEARALGRRVAELEALLAHEKARGDHEKARADGLEEEAAMASLPDESIDTVRVFVCVAR